MDLQFVGWQAYDSLNVVFNEKILQIEDIKAEKNYKNTMIYRVGAQYLATERLDVRMGIYYDQSPIRKHNYNPETPGMGKLGFSAGLSSNLTGICRWIWPFCISRAFPGMALIRISIVRTASSPVIINPMPLQCLSVWLIAFRRKLSLRGKFLCFTGIFYL